MLIKGALLCDYRLCEKGDIRIEESKIVAIDSELHPLNNEPILEAHSLTLLPSLIDLNVSVQDKTLSTKNLLTLSHCAHQGGVGTIMLMPDTQPRVDSEEVIEFINSMQTMLNLNVIPAAFGTRENQTLSELSILAKKGCKAIFLESSLEGNLMRRVCDYGLFLKLPLICRCEDSSLRGNGVMNDSYLSARLGLPGIPTLSEVKEVAKMGEVAVFMGNSILFSAMSSEQSLKILEKYKQENPSIFAECSIHHLALTEDLCDNYNTAAKILPPLKSEATRQKLLDSLKKGKIDVLTSLHSASGITAKDRAFEEASFGIESLQYYFSLLYTFLAANKTLSLSEVSRYSSYNPAQILHLNKGELVVGKDADFILVDLQSSYNIENSLSPYYGYNLQGEVVYSFLLGECHYRRDSKDSKRNLS